MSNKVVTIYNLLINVSKLLGLPCRWFNLPKDVVNHRHVLSDSNQ